MKVQDSKSKNLFPDRQRGACTLVTRINSLEVMLKRLVKIGIILYPKAPRNSSEFVCGGLCIPWVDAALGWVSGRRLFFGFPVGGLAHSFAPGSFRSRFSSSLLHKKKTGPKPGLCPSGLCTRVISERGRSSSERLSPARSKNHHCRWCWSRRWRRLATALRSIPTFHRSSR